MINADSVQVPPDTQYLVILSIVLPFWCIFHLSMGDEKSEPRQRNASSSVGKFVTVLQKFGHVHYITKWVVVVVLRVNF